MKNFQIQLLDASEQKWTINDYANIGSDSTCAIQIFGANISERHARLEVRQKQVFIKDLRSEAGTYINGAQIVEAVLNDGDIILIGQAELLFTDVSIIKNEFPIQSRNEYWNQQLKTLGSVAQTPYPVLLLGPSGVGKDILAQNLHEGSHKPDSPFVSVNCSALTETLVESELFGHVKGSFTGAIADRKGAFESARGGTLFLDEIGDLPYNLQAKLLRALENNEIRPVGSDKSIKTQVRIIAATHQNLYDKIREGSFRADLFYRLNVITVEVPSLKERMEDFDDIFYTFAKKMKVRFSFNAIQTLKKYEWPGNIRELKNVVARASALFPKTYIENHHIDTLLNRKEKLASYSANISSSGNNSNGGVGYFSSPQQMSVIKEIEKQMIIKRLTANKGNQKLTASDLGMPKSTLHDRIKHYQINPVEFKV